MSYTDVLNGSARWSVQQGDCIELMAGMPDDSVQLVMGSPPYEDCRTYGIGFRLKGQAWVDWMVRVFAEAQRICLGPVVMVLEGKTSDFRWSATPALLMADLHRAGFCLRKPPIFQRVGIPGSGGPDWLRNDYEFIVVTTRPGKLPWSENTACGHPPKWAPGGEMSHRLTDGTRRNQWGKNGPVGNRKANGERDASGPRPSHRTTTKREARGFATSGHDADSDTPNGQGYDPPALANPGNVIRLNVGGGQMGGDAFASQNEAPFPESLCEFFVRSFAPPDGIVVDPFVGSGTTPTVAVRWHRRAIGFDLRQSQVDLARRRIEVETPLFPEMV